MCERFSFAWFAFDWCGASVLCVSKSLSWMKHWPLKNDIVVCTELTTRWSVWFSSSTFKSIFHFQVILKSGLLRYSRLWNLCNSILCYNHNWKKVATGLDHSLLWFNTHVVLWKHISITTFSLSAQNDTANEILSIVILWVVQDRIGSFSNFLPLFSFPHVISGTPWCILKKQGHGCTVPCFCLLLQQLEFT